MEESIVLVSLPVLQFGTSQKALASQNASLGPEISISVLRKLYVSLIIFLDNIPLMTSSKTNLCLEGTPWYIYFRILFLDKCL